MRSYQQENKIWVKLSNKYHHHCAQHHITGLQIQIVMIPG